MKLTSTDRRIIEARILGVCLNELSDKDLRSAIDQIMLRGAAISGCPLPTTEFFAEIIAEELIVFIQDFGYAHLTLEEVLLALRLNANGGVKYSAFQIEPIFFSGHCFNVDYVSKVLSNYITLRSYFERKIQNHIDGY